MKKIALTFLTMPALLISLGVQARGGTVTLQSTNIASALDVNYTDFTLTSGKGAFTPPASASQAGGTYTYAAGDAVLSVASGSFSGTAFALTITNNTGRTLTGINFQGTRYQAKGNTGNVSETLVASITGTNPGLTAANFNIGTVSATSGINNPLLTAAWSVNILSGLNFANGTSFTVTWSDANDSGTDAMFGLGNVTIRGISAIPEPHEYGIAFAGMLVGLVVIRNRQIRIRNSTGI